MPIEKQATTDATTESLAAPDAARRAILGRSDAVVGTLMDLVVHKVVAGGDGLARAADGRVVFVPAVLPGEHVRVRLVEVKRDLAKAELVEVLRPSSDRIAPPCPHVARGCGGCSWQHATTAAQLTLKQDIVREALARTGGLADAVVDLGPALPAVGFRTTLRVAVEGSRPGVTPGRHAAGRPQPGLLPTVASRVGFRAHRHHDVVVVDDCLVAHPLLAELLPALHASGASEVMLRCSPATGERLALADEAGARLEGLPGDVGVGPRAKLREVVDGVTLQVSAGSFFQSRSDGAEALVAAVRRAAGPMPEGRTIDAYGGVGLFAATVLRETEVVVIESVPCSVTDAMHNLVGQAATIERVTVERWRPVRADLVVADPARRGLGAAAVDVLAATRAARLVLVSCDPVSLARDAKLLAAKGLRHERTTVIDLFPHTAHIEAVSAFVRD